MGNLLIKNVVDNINNCGEERKRSIAGAYYVHESKSITNVLNRLNKYFKKRYGKRFYRDASRKSA